MNALRLAALAALPLLAACAVTVPVDVTRDVTVEAAAAGSFSRTEAVDLATSAGSLWSKRSKVDAVSVDEVTATVLSVATGRGATIGLTLAFRPDGAPSDGGQDVAVGTLSGLALTPGTTAALPGSAALDAMLLSVVQGSGKFTAVAGGSASAPVSAVLRVELKGSATKKVGG
jgi:hypothetical protein